MNWRTKEFVCLTSLQYVLYCGGLELHLQHLRVLPVLSGKTALTHLLNVAICLLPHTPLLCFFPQSRLISYLIYLLMVLVHCLPPSVCVCVCVCVQSLQSCPTWCSPMDCSLLGSSVRGSLQ